VARTVGAEGILASDHDPDISRWGGVFTNSEREISYQAQNWDATARRIRLVAVAGGVFYLAGFAVDLLLVQDFQLRFALLGIRVAVAALVLSFGLALTRPLQRPRWCDAGLAAVVLAMGAATCAIIALSPGYVIVHALTVIVILLVVYLFVPASPTVTTWCGVLISLGFLGVVLSRFEPKADELALVVLYLALVNVLGSFGDRLEQRTRRRQFATLEAERRAREALRREVEARGAAEQALVASEERYRNLVEHSPHAIVLHRRGEVVYANPEAARIVAADGPSSLVGLKIADYVDEDSAALIRERLAALDANGAPLPPAQVRLRAQNGRWRDVEIVSTLATFPEGLAVQTVARDVTDRKRLEEELTRLATTDTLTGAHNRHSFFVRGEAEVARARRHRRPLSAMMFDIDLFKQVNDRWGHAVGDEVLAVIGRACRAALRTEDLFGRIGGEEFAVLLPEIDIAAAASAAERLRNRLAGLRVRGNGDKVSVTVSVGVSQLLPRDRGLDDILKRADDALYTAKRAGRNRVECDPARTAVTGSEPASP
jgi:diguanylate cyclase (GGDEF)-like protein/PAS domain S-box-containing protein